jgi:hypothetical protein
MLAAWLRHLARHRARHTGTSDPQIAAVLGNSTSGDMREMSVRGGLVYCADYYCSHSVALSADRWPEGMRLSDIQPHLVRKIGAEPHKKTRHSRRASFGSSLAALPDAQVLCRRLARTAISHELVTDARALCEAGKARFFNRADVYEHVLPTIVGLDESVTFSCIEPLYNSDSHYAVSKTVSKGVQINGHL